ncbi:molybdenum cofactor biosynthesis protein C [Salmonella enterica subsp. enterica serovar Daytona]|uniref:Molybdenum cofactor biosynthesis protein C n=1 Tax=Salmonella enterica subsp. enterica serovar Daytona TaxID=1962639 RepID=A0A447JKQ8_SALET|nr:molybdenum cofactor biosynthesis protein C [Salmonella enterica subsp. enterica serovar Daytona]
MVDVSAKAETVREARAEAFVTMRSENAGDDC